MDDTKRTGFSPVDRVNQNQALRSVQETHQFDAERTSVENFYSIGKAEAL